ncbi:hypothetical protein HG530_000103 [Fusarium avenaceum]|nr:hypothetical protein HG530_000103 [Fusarium avenaceum]
MYSVDNFVFFNLLNKFLFLILSTLEQSIGVLSDAPGTCLCQAFLGNVLLEVDVELLHGDGVSMSLDSIGLNGDDLDQSIESHVSDVVVAIGKELAQDIDTENPQTGVGFDVENSAYSFIQNRVTNVFGGLCVGSNLGQDIIDLLACLCIAYSQDSQQVQNLDLKEGVGNASDIMFGQELRCLLDEVLLQIGNLATYAHGTESCFSSNIGIGRGNKGLDFGEKISGHLDRSDIS